MIVKNTINATIKKFCSNNILTVPSNVALNCISFRERLIKGYILNITNNNKDDIA